MAVVVFPVDAVTGAPSYTGRLARQTMSPLLAGATAARPLGARSGVRPGTSATTVTATSTTWTVNNHAGILDMETAGEAGPYAYAVNAPIVSATVVAADATRPRIDIVWVRLDDPAESDGSSVPAVVAGYTAGAPLASPVAPATPARCMVLATIQVPISGGGAPTVIWAAPYAVAAGVLDPAVTAIGATPSAAIGTVPAIVVTAPSVTTDGTKTYRITAFVRSFVGTVSGDLGGLQIYEAVAGVSPSWGFIPIPLVVAGGLIRGTSSTFSVSHTPAAGTRTYRADISIVGGTGTITAYNAQIIVEQIA